MYDPTVNCVSIVPAGEEEAPADRNTEVVVRWHGAAASGVPSDGIIAYKGFTRWRSPPIPSASPSNRIEPMHEHSTAAAESDPSLVMGDTEKVDEAIIAHPLPSPVQRPTRRSPPIPVVVRLFLLPSSSSS
jgi:hypothetical protein